jgi:hypothetical protein
MEEILVYYTITHAHCEAPPCMDSIGDNVNPVSIYNNSDKL